nr:transcriptional regulator FilR1 domain-containing protein [Methanosarcina sp. UBA289]
MKNDFDFGKDGEFDHRKITSCTPSALEWSNKLVQYYIGSFTKINYNYNG